MNQKSPGEIVDFALPETKKSNITFPH